MNELREDLDRALRTVTISEAPVERARRDGRRIRTRRRAALLAGALAVAAVAAGYPALTGSDAAPQAPASGKSAPPRHSPANGDPLITGGSGGDTTEGPAGLVSAAGQIASGTLGGVPWHVTVRAPAKANPVPADPCFTVSAAPGDDLGTGCTDLAVDPAGELSRGVPAVFAGASDLVTEATVGEVGTGVTYFFVTFADGQQLKLIPVMAHGHRYVAWVAPLSMTVASVVAHLGGPYSDSGQTSTAVPFTQRGQAPVFGAWQKPGEPVPPRASGVIGHGTGAGHQAWSAVAYTGPWGSCAVVDGQGFDCIAAAPLNGVAILGPVLSSAQGLEVILGGAPAGAARVTIALAGGQSVTARPVAVGGDHLFAVAAPTSAVVTGWTTYDASGHQTGSGSIAPASSGAAKPAGS